MKIITITLLLVCHLQLEVGVVEEEEEEQNRQETYKTGSKPSSRPAGSELVSFVKEVIPI